MRGRSLPLKRLTLGLLVFPAVWDWYLGWRERRRGFYTQWEVDMLRLGQGPARRDTGWLRRSPELADALEPCEGLVSSADVTRVRADWGGACDAVHAHALARAKDVQRVARVHRNPFEAILPVLEAEEGGKLRPSGDWSSSSGASCAGTSGPAAGRSSSRRRPSRTRAPPSSPTALFAWFCLTWTAFTATWTPTWSVIGPRSWAPPPTRRPSSSRRPRRPAAARPTTRPPSLRLGDRRSSATASYLYTGRGAIAGLLPHGPQNVRDVLATHVVKQTGSFEQASYAIQDTPDMVAKHYGRFLPQHKPP